jgi:hypothetical protein
LFSCVSSQNGTVTFNIPIRKSQIRSTMGSLLRDSAAEDHIEQVVNSVTIDSFLGDDSTESFAAWIDVEGAVDSILAGASRSLRFCSAVYVELETSTRWPNQALAHDIVPMLTASGLVPLACDIQREWQFNAIFVKPEALVNSSVIDACQRYFFASGVRA